MVTPLRPWDSAHEFTPAQQGQGWTEGNTGQAEHTAKSSECPTARRIRPARRSRIQLGPNQFAFVSRFVGHTSMYSGNPEKKNGPALHKNMFPAAQHCGTSALFSCQLGAFAAAAVGVASPLSGLSQLKGLQGSLALAMASKAFRFINSSSDKSLFSATKLAAVRCWGGVGAAAAASVGFDDMRHTSVSMRSHAWRARRFRGGTCKSLPNLDSRNGCFDLLTILLPYPLYILGGQKRK